MIHTYLDFNQYFLIACNLLFLKNTSKSIFLYTIILIIATICIYIDILSTINFFSCKTKCPNEIHLTFFTSMYQILWILYLVLFIFHYKKEA